MAIKFVMIMCLFGLVRGGNLHGGSALGYSSGLGYNSGHGYSASISHGSGLGYGGNFGHGTNVAYVSGLNSGSYGSNSHGYDNLGASVAFSKPAISTVSQYNVHTAPQVYYSSQYSQGGSAINYGGQGANGYELNGHGYSNSGSGYGYVSGYGNKW